MDRRSSPRAARRSRLAWKGVGRPASTALASPTVVGPAERRMPPVPPRPQRTFAPVQTGLEHIPDLLRRSAAVTVDAAMLGPKLEFAFAGGDVSDVFEIAFDGATTVESDWDPECFFSDLFVDDLVASWAAVDIGASTAHLNASSLAHALSTPPRDPSVAEMRREILGELKADPKHRKTFEEVYTRLCQVRDGFVHHGTDSRHELTRRRIDTLSALRDAFSLMASAFEGATSELARVRHFAREVQATDAFRHLVELLDYENNLASVDVHMQVGVDGRVRRFQIIDVSENERNRFYKSPLGRLVAKFLLWARGYRFSDDELVDRWLDRVFADLAYLIPILFQLLAHMEFFLAGLAFADHCATRGLKVSFPEMVDDGPRDIQGLFNPLLFAQGITPKPCDLRSDGFDAMTIVTGPNSGGKTRLLQALGITQMLAQSGFYVPAASARLRRASALFVSLIEEASVDQREGRLGTELIRIRRLFEKSRSGALVILDELCSGTNPSEGEEIFMLVISLLRELRPQVFITTHFLQFANRLLERNDELGLHFLQVDLDEHQRPTYRFVPGVADTSLAAQTAARLGVTREELMALIRQNRDG